jgi:hypothetical protein
VKFLLLGLVTFFVVTIVMAVVFRDRRARGRIRFLVKLGWAYVIAVVILAAVRIYVESN